MAVTVLIVDDEKLIRAGIRKILNDDIAESEQGIDLELNEARNGEEALEWCKSHPTQLVITDIRMPKMDGVELMKNLNQLESKPTIIVLSGFDDFNYAKAAISYGAISYILKPVDRKELVEAVRGAIASYLHTDRARAESQLKVIVQEGVITDPEALPLEFMSKGFRYVQIAADNPDYIIEHALSGTTWYLIEKRQNLVSVVVPAYFDVAQRIAQVSAGHGYCAVGCSQSGENISALRSLQRQALLALFQQFFDETTRIHEFTEAPDTTEMATLDLRYESTVARIDTLSADDMRKAVAQWFNFPKEIKPVQKAALLSYLYTKITNNLLKRYTEYTEVDGYLTSKGIMVSNIWRCETLTEWQHQVTDYLVYLSALVQQNASEIPFIRDALKYVREHFREELTMTMVANHVSTNYTWFSEKFVEQTGLHFNDYLKRIRIAEARKLLTNQCLKVYEVAEQCGFPDTKYFIKVFRNECGMTPTEFRRSFQK